MEWRDLALLPLVAAAAPLLDEGTDGPPLPLEPFFEGYESSKVRGDRFLVELFVYSFNVLHNRQCIVNFVGSSIGEQQPTRIKLKDAFMTYGTIY